MLAKTVLAIWMGSLNVSVRIIRRSLGVIPSLFEKRYQICSSCPADTSRYLLIRVFQMNMCRCGKVDPGWCVLWRRELGRHDDIPRDDPDVLVTERAERHDSCIVCISDRRPERATHCVFAEVGVPGEHFQKPAVGTGHVVSHVLRIYQFDQD